ncbi:Fpg/Nei family DNA glycosylase [Sinomonas humi]|uniref:DNA-(apurinic or apyrimidinic site) lyase n=1 Tax=Sinomonas humi TaxID=1338436 RepID=A0A0B2AA29_9MICC|nr:DNA glycosylase [Sinomonas humi]KHL00414.1 formamidopyrimidine-DNA glycosylase [Sinomonas humi]
MPEGHSIHRLARQFNDVFAGERLVVTSPQGRFSAGAGLLDSRVLESAQAHGKQLFLRFEGPLYLHVHLGLYGAWDFGGDATFRGASSIGAPRRVGERELVDDDGDSAYAGPPPPVGAVRVRLASEHGWADLRGATVCAVATQPEVEAVLARLGPDPLGLRASGTDPGEAFAQRVNRRRTPIARLLMDQTVVAGIGNVYRAELLFRARLEPAVLGSALGTQRALELWADAVQALGQGVRDGRIITTDPSIWTSPIGSLPAPEEAHWVYKRQGLECRICGTAILLADEAGRKLYWCPACQTG